MNVQAGQESSCTPAQFAAGTNNFHLLKINRSSGLAKVTFCEMVQQDFSLFIYIFNFTFFPDLFFLIFHNLQWS